MYKYSLGPSLKQRYDRPVRTLVRNDSCQRFSSFETPPQSEDQCEQFSDYDTPRHEIQHHCQSRESSKKERSYIKVQQMPLQFQKSASAVKNRQIKMSSNGVQCQIIDQNHAYNIISSLTKAKQGQQLKQSCPLRYNYMSKIERQLSTIKEDLRESGYSSITKPMNNSHMNLKAEINVGSTLMKSNFQKVYIQQQMIKIAVLQKQNAILKQRVVGLQFQVSQERRRRSNEQIAEKMALANHEQYITSARIDIKNKFLQEIAALQIRCKEMRDEMTLYKSKQEVMFAELLRQKDEEKQSHIMYQVKYEYQSKFIEVFLNMVQKLPVQLSVKWSEKKKIAVGWKVVKHLIKKALKLGIQLPSIVGKDELQ